MDVLRKACSAGVAMALIVASSPALSWAATSGPVAVSVTVTLDSIASLTPIVDAGSSPRDADPTKILFDKTDLQNMAPDPTANANFMYAPYRSEVGKNWHVLHVTGNGAVTTLSATVAGVVGAKNLKDILYGFCGGFYPSNGDPELGKKSGDWEKMDGFIKSAGSFDGSVPMNYQLRIDGVTTGSYAGTVTYTLVST